MRASIKTTVTPLAWGVTRDLHFVGARAAFIFMTKSADFDHGFMALDRPAEGRFQEL